MRINEVIDSDDDMFAPSARTNTERAIKQVLDAAYNHYQDLYDKSDPNNSEEWHVKLGEYLSDYDFLRSELARGGIKSFLNGLDMVGLNILETIDSELAIKHKIYLNQLDDQYLDEDDTDLFSSSSKFSNLKKMKTDTLLMLWNAIKDDNRPEYAEAHRQQKIRLGLALASRGIYVPYPMGGAPVNLDENINIPLGTHKGK